MVSASPKNPYQKILQFFLPKGEGSHPIQKSFIRFFGIICQKLGVFSNETGSFLTIFCQKGGGLGLVKKILIRKKTEVVKKGGGGSQFFYSK